MEQITHTRLGPLHGVAACTGLVLAAAILAADMSSPLALPDLGTEAARIWGGLALALAMASLRWGGPLGKAWSKGPGKRLRRALGLYIRRPGEYL